MTKPCRTLAQRLTLFACGAGLAAIVATEGVATAQALAQKPGWCVPGQATLHTVRADGDSRDSVLCHGSSGQLWRATSDGTSFVEAPLPAAFCPSSDGVFSTFRRPNGTSLLVCHREQDMLIRTDVAGASGTVVYPMTDTRCRPSAGARFRFGQLPGAALGGALLCHNGDGRSAVVFALTCSDTTAPCNPTYVDTGLGVNAAADPKKNDFFLANFDGINGADVLFHDTLAGKDTVRVSTSASVAAFAPNAAIWSDSTSTDTRRYPCAAGDDFGLADFTGDGKSDAWCRSRTSGDVWVGKTMFDASRFNWQKWIAGFCPGKSRVNIGLFNIDGPGTDGNSGQRADVSCTAPNNERRVALAPLDHTTNAFLAPSVWSAGF
jgi:hypothetical protein